MEAVLSGFLVLAFLGLGKAGEEQQVVFGDPPGGDEPQSSGTVRLTSPTVTNEEAYSHHMPEHLRCDACKAILHQMQEYLAKAKSKRSSVKHGQGALSESEVTDVLDRCCSQSWENYGLKEVNGVKRLSGPGLEAEKHMGMVMMGGPWPKRLLQMCHGYLGDVGEEEIYQEYRKSPKSLEKLLCYGSGGTCSKSQPEGRSEHKEKTWRNEL
ncbi:marginal zone B- and B1-cell-specific protein [Latimeria chalumnae]|uniref:Marginal zone B and B1 cell specific protein n=1 Tax=Latimeria chalumnae TaxID=7897 RepID=M3XKM6_LATCH|nr:PREDICTED: marginal zone B- and B1-cell-specific protein [Latimeria chalumnae]|eukprot:XP_005989381.1 PREDICTED: marginal zone B- and B1-cell-specific protein [Latimeria chalumnae]